MRKKTDPIERAKKAAIALAKVRLQQVNFSTKELTDALRTHGFPYFVEGVTMLKKLGLITKDSDGYHFTTKDPIHFSTLRSSLDELYSRYSKQSKNEVIVDSDGQYFTTKDPSTLRASLAEEKFAYLVDIEGVIAVILSEEKLLEFIKQNRTVTIEKIKIYG